MLEDYSAIQLAHNALAMQVFLSRRSLANQFFWLAKSLKWDLTLEKHMFQYSWFKWWGTGARRLAQPSCLWVENVSMGLDNTPKAEVNTGIYLAVWIKVWGNLRKYQDVSSILSGRALHRFVYKISPALCRVTTRLRSNHYTWKYTTQFIRWAFAMLSRRISPA